MLLLHFKYFKNYFLKYFIYCVILKMAQIASISQREIFPSNRANPQNSWSYKNGNPTLIFDINEQEAYLMTGTLRLNFKLRLQQSTGTTAVPVYPNNAAAAGGAAVEIRQNSKIGALSCFSSISVHNSRNQTLERVLNAPRLAATLVPTGADFTAYATDLQLECAATSSDDANGRRQNSEQEVCSRVLCGCFLMGEPMPLGGVGKGTAGLQIRFNLAPSIEANYGANAAGSFYEVLNPSLTYQVGLPAGGALPSISALPYTSFSSYYAVISNGDQTENINCGLSSVISTFTNFVPTTYIANEQQDGNETYTLRNAPYTSDTQYAPVQQYTAFRSGLKYPYQFTVDEDEMINQVGANFNAEGYTAQRQRNFLSALQPSKDRVSTLAGNISESGIGAAPTPTIDQDRYNTLGKHCFGVGTRMDGLGIGSSANFKNASFSHRFRSALNGVSPNSAYTFMLHRNMINYGGGGISVAN
jgi:hypothetical protein